MKTSWPSSNTISAPAGGAPSTRSPSFARRPRIAPTTLPTCGDDAVTVAIRRRVKTGREAAFEEALREFIPQSLTFPGHLGVQVLRPTPGASTEWVVVIKFQSHGAYDTFRSSPEYLQWTAQIRDLLENDPAVDERCGLESWFVLPGSVSEPVLPRWKMALVTWIGVNVAVIGLTLLLNPLVGAWPLIPQALFVNTLVVVLLTWAIMPLLTRMLRRWLYPSTTRPAGRIGEGEHP